MRHVIVGVGPDLWDTLRAARTGYAGPINENYKVMKWNGEEWE